nr:acyl--CoA ligase [Pseudomonas sp.]
MSFRRIHEVIHPWAESQPQALALQDAGSRLTYGELEVSVLAAAEQLRALGVRAGDRVLMVAENCAALALTVLAASALDAWVVIVNARLSPREIDNFIEHSGARRVLYTTEVSADAMGHATRAGATPQIWPGTGSIAAGPLNEAAVPEPVHEDPAEQVAAMIYTSGTSGSPKGVMLTHANLLFIAEVNRQLRRLGPLDKVYGVLPMAHVVGLSTQLIGSLSCGSALLLEARFTPEALVRAIREESLTLMIGVP